MKGDRRFKSETAENAQNIAAPRLQVTQGGKFPSELKVVSDTASDYLESGASQQALEWFQEAVRIARATGQEATLCGILGDMAVAFRRVGDVERAKQTYEEAIRLSRQHSDWLNLSRWCQNLGLLLLEQDLASASACLKEGLEAAALSAIPYQISTAAGNYAVVLARQQRFREAVEALDEASRAADSPKLAGIWKNHLLAVLLQWGAQLREEGQTNDALKVFQHAAEAADNKDPEQLSSAAYAWSSVAELQERSGQLAASRDSIIQAASLYRALGDEERASQLEQVAGELGRGSRTVHSVEDAGLDVTQLEREIEAAVTAGDQPKEATARMNFVAALQLAGDTRVNSEFENTMALVHRLRDRRRELILCLNFAPHFLREGDTKRALTLAERGVKLAESGNPGSKIYALANRGEIRLNGMNETGRALEDFRQCAQLLKAYMRERPDDLGVANNVKHVLLAGAKAALTAGDVAAAGAIAEIFEPNLAAALKRPREEKSSAPDVDGLRELSEPALDRVLAVWHTKGPSRPPDDPAISQLASLAGMLGWQWAAERLSRQLASERKVVASKGAAGLLRLAEMVVDREITIETAAIVGRKLQVPEDDLDCIALFALSDKARASKGIAFMAFQLIVAISANAECQARCYNLLGMFSASSDPEGALEFYRRGERVLAGTELKADRAHLLNEAAALLVGALRRFEESLPLSELAARLAEETGNKKDAANSLGNNAVALMSLNRADEAVKQLNRVASLQEEIGDIQGLQNTRFNLTQAYARLRPTERAPFERGSTDPDVVFANATNLALSGQRDEAVAEFVRGLAIVALRKPPYAAEGQMRMNFARTLFDTGDRDRATEEMKKAVVSLEAGHHERDLHDAFTWLASMLVEDDIEGLRYADQAIALSRRMGDDEKLAIDLGQLGQNRLLAGHPEQALEPLEEADRLLHRSEIRSALAQVFLAVGRAPQARRIYEELIASNEASDPSRKASWMIGLSEVFEKMGEGESALALLSTARDLISPLGESRESAYVANHFGLALLKRGMLEQAAETLEAGVEQARSLGLWRLELSLLTNFGNALKELGDLDGAEDVLNEVRDKCRKRGIAKSEAVAVASLGNISSSRGDTQGALGRFQEAADLAHGVDSSTEATCVDSLGAIYSRLGKPARAIEYHLRAVELHESLYDWDALVLDQINVTQTYLALGESKLASEWLHRAEQLSRERNITHWSVPYMAGLVLTREGRWPEAKVQFRTAIETIESIRGSLPTPTAQRQWAASQEDLYRRAMEAALEMQDGEAAVEFIECGRARYLKAIVERHSRRPAGISDDAWLRYEQAQDRYAQLRAHWRSQIARGDPSLDEQLRQADAELKSATVPVAAAADVATAPALPQFTELIARVPVGHVAVWMTHGPDSVGFAWAGMSAEGTPWAAATLYKDDLAAALNNLIFGNSKSLEAARSEQTALDQLPPGDVGFRLAAHFLGQDESYLDVARRVYGYAVSDSDELFSATLKFVSRWLGEKLWPIIESRLPAGTQDIILLPSAALNLLPWHSAVGPSGKRIDETYRVHYLPSLAMMTDLGPLPANSNLGQVVNPSADAGLPFSRVEADCVKETFGKSVSRLDGPQATSSKVLTLLKRSGVFHFAGHAFYDSRDPFASGLICASKAKQEDVLTVANIVGRTQSISSRLVVLSACETGQVDPTDQLEDFLGLPGAFLVAGAQTVVASLWRVDDLAACILMEKFFATWDGGRADPSHALALAQQWLRSEVTVKYVVSKLSQWSEQYANPPEVVQTTLWNLTARDDQDALAFPNETDWAAFYVTGLLTPRS
jgi:CHAT domain-containing protein/tetratricopeptide (TPR) repeat protein